MFKFHKKLTLIDSIACKFYKLSIKKCNKYRKIKLYYVMNHYIISLLTIRPNGY